MGKSIVSKTNPLIKMTQLSAIQDYPGLSRTIQDYPCPHIPLLPGTAQHVAVTQPSASPSDASDIVDATDPLRFTKGFALASCSWQHPNI